MQAVVMAAGEGRRLRPITERWPKPLLPIDGRPVLATLLRALASARVTHAWLVVGHLADQVRALVGGGESYGIRVTYVRQPAVLGSADAVQRAIAAGADAPLLVVAADTMFAHGDIARVIDEGRTLDGAIAVRRDPPPGPGRSAVAVRDGVVTSIDADDRAEGLSGAPLWIVGPRIVAHLCRDEPPFELAHAFEAAIDAGARIAGVEIGKTRDLTDPLDLVEENFPYLSR